MRIICRLASINNRRDKEGFNIDRIKESERRKQSAVGNGIKKERKRERRRTYPKRERLKNMPKETNR